LFALVSRFGSLDGPDHSFDPFPTVLRKALSLSYFIFLQVPFSFPSSNNNNKKKKEKKKQ
jgi:hypothetical protein